VRTARGWVVVQSPDCEEAIEAGHLECSHRRPRPDEDEQLTSLRTLAPARSEEQGKRGRVDEGDQAEVDGQVTHFPVKTVSVRGRGDTEKGFVVPIAVQFQPNRLCQRPFDGRGAVQVELASEDKNRCLAPIPLESQGEIAWPGGPGALTAPRRTSARSTNLGCSGLDLLIVHHDA
jgi:hypothetical protein